MTNSIYQNNFNMTILFLMYILIAYYIVLPIVKITIKINKELKENI